jgi:hypothetical protein
LCWWRELYWCVQTKFKNSVWDVDKFRIKCLSAFYHFTTHIDLFVVARHNRCLEAVQQQAGLLFFSNRWTPTCSSLNTLTYSLLLKVWVWHLNTTESGNWITYVLLCTLWQKLQLAHLIEQPIPAGMYVLNFSRWKQATW